MTKGISVRHRLPKRRRHSRRVAIVGGSGGIACGLHLVEADPEDPDSYYWAGAIDVTMNTPYTTADVHIDYVTEVASDTVKVTVLDTDTPEGIATKLKNALDAKLEIAAWVQGTNVAFESMSGDILSVAARWTTVGGTLLDGADAPAPEANTLPKAKKTKKAA
jgi:hypothetical protein